MIWSSSQIVQFDRHVTFRYLETLGANVKKTLSLIMQLCKLYVNKPSLI